MKKVVLALSCFFASLTASAEVNFSGHWVSDDVKVSCDNGYVGSCKANDFAGQREDSWLGGFIIAIDCGGAPFYSLGAAVALGGLEIRDEKLLYKNYGGYPAPPAIQVGGIAGNSIAIDRNFTNKCGWRDGVCNPALVMNTTLTLTEDQLEVVFSNVSYMHQVCEIRGTYRSVFP